MHARPLIAAIALGIVACGTAVGLEAVGVLFHSGAPTAQGPEQRAAAILTRLETDLDSMVAPSRPVDLPSESVDVPGEAPPPWQDAEPATAAAPAPEAVDEPAEGQHRTDAEQPDGKGPALALSMPVNQGLRPESSPGEPLLAARLTISEPEPVTVLAAAQTANPARPAPQRSARPARLAAARASVGGGPFGCPVLDWLTP
jgi:hypothetical protein